MSETEYLNSLTQEEWNLLLSTDIKNLCNYVKYCKHQLPLNELLKQVPELEVYFIKMMELE
jgi:hypothetical protein